MILSNKKGQAMRKSHDVEYEIKGSDLQFVEIILDPHETVISEPGAMMFMEQGVQMKASLGDGSEKHKGVLGTISGLGKRYFTGEKLFITAFTNNSNVRRGVAFAGNYAGKIKSIDLAEYGGAVYCQRGSFICAAKGVAVEFGFRRR
jgi:uncharacterized protein (AIM24 family)